MGVEVVIGFIVGMVCGKVLRWWQAPDGTETPGDVQGSEAEAAASTPVPESGAEPVSEESPSVPEVEPASPKGDLKAEIIAMLRISPEGLTLSEMGQRMQRHFAALIGPIRLLMEEGRVERQDRIYKLQ